MSFPMTHTHPQIPILAQAPIGDWGRAGMPYLTVKGRRTLCIRIAEHDPRGLAHIFTVANSVLGNDINTANQVPDTSDSIV